MQPILADVQVNYHYEVHFTTHLFAPENPLLRDVVTGRSDHLPARVLFVVEEEVDRHLGVAAAIEDYCRRHAASLAQAGPTIVLPGGERVKNDPAHVHTVHQAVHDTGLDRHSYLAAVGGGALLDAVGYAAATAHRGVRLLRVPTTTLSQNDSGVGVKNAINAFGKKNWVGTFAPAWAVLNDAHLLTTQPDRVWREGIAEAVKVALIKDADFFAALEDDTARLTERDMPAMQRLIRRCAELHVQHICAGGDPFEMGSSRPLDFGHWAAHKLEQITDHRLHHGEAVAVGLALDVTYSHLQGWLTADEWRRVLRVLSGVGFAVFAPEMKTPALFQGLREFREHLGGELTIQMLRRIGEGFNVHEIDEAMMTRSIAALEAEARRLEGEYALPHADGGHAPELELTEAEEMAPDAALEAVR
jgi:3-dehydroquinate synthase